MSGALRERFLAKRRPLVVAGTHGKTTTSAMCAWLLVARGLRARAGSSAACPRACRRARRSGRRASGRVRAARPFVVEGDEYDAVYWHKQPKFFDYVGVGPDDVAIVTSIEHDHIDIYPDVASYEEAFRAFVRARARGGPRRVRRARPARPRDRPARGARARRLVRARARRHGRGDARVDRRPRRRRWPARRRRSTSSRAACRAGASRWACPGTTTCATPWPRSPRAPRDSARA